MKIYIDGADNLGWHVDVERQHLKEALTRLGVIEEPSALGADIIHNVWWDSFICNRTRFERCVLQFKKNVLLTASNFIDLDDPLYDRRSLFKRINKYKRAWIVPSLKQKKVLERHNILCFYQPFYLDLSLFHPLRDEKRKDELAHELGIPREIYRDKVIIGSFQRDSDGKCLTQPKWQKDPDLMLAILKDLPRKAFVLLLAGPRRHYVLKKCKEYNISYWYIGTEKEEDDLNDNALDISLMPKLYAFIDLYVVTSRSEGGPKAILEATATKTLLMSTDVGLAADFLHPGNVFRKREEYIKAVHDFVMRKGQGDVYKMQVDEQYKTCKNLLDQNAMDHRLLNIYTASGMRTP